MKKILFVTSTATLFAVGVMSCDKKKTDEAAPMADKVDAAMDAKADPAMDAKADAHKDAAAHGADADAAAKAEGAHAEEAKTKKSDHPSGGEHPN